MSGLMIIVKFTLKILRYLITCIRCYSSLLMKKKNNKVARSVHAWKP